MVVVKTFDNDDDHDVGNNDDEVCYKVLEEYSYYWQLVVIVRIFMIYMASVIVTAVLMTNTMEKGVINNVG